MENPRISYGWPLHPQFHICGFNPPQTRVVLQYLLLKKNPHISGPAQFKPMLFKGQLYFLSYTFTISSPQLRSPQKTCPNGSYCLLWTQHYKYYLLLSSKQLCKWGVVISILHIRKTSSVVNPGVPASQGKLVWLTTKFSVQFVANCCSILYTCVLGNMNTTVVEISMWWFFWNIRKFWEWSWVVLRNNHFLP